MGAQLQAAERCLRRDRGALQRWKDDLRIERAIGDGDMRQVVLRADISGRCPGKATADSYRPLVYGNQAWFGPDAKVDVGRSVFAREEAPSAQLCMDDRMRWNGELRFQRL